MHRAVNIWPFNGYFASKSITNPASAVAPTTPSYAAVSQAPSVTVQEQATFSYPAYKSYDKPDNGDKTEVKAEDLVGAISTPASPPPPDPNKNNSDESNYDFGKLGKLVKHPGTKIDWSKVTTHAVEQMAKRGITRNMVETWVKTGQALQQVGGKYLFVSKDGAAVVNQAGKVITAYSRATYDANMWRVVKILFGI